MGLFVTGLAVGLLGVAFWMLGHWARCVRPECQVCGVELRDVLVSTADGGFVLVLPGPRSGFGSVLPVSPEP